MEDDILDEYCSSDRPARDHMWFRYRHLRDDFDRLEKSNYCQESNKKPKNMVTERQLRLGTSPVSEIK